MRPTVLLILCALTAGAAPAALKTISSPQGGKIVYGQVEGATSEAGAMGAVLRNLHTQLGDKPNVGRIFRVRGTNSVAVFFTVRNQRSLSVAGMLIAATFAPGHVEAALLSDDANRFGASINPLLKQLLAVWRPPDASAALAKPAALRPFTLQDRSASVSLPEGWNVMPSSGGGTIMAQGPNDEAVLLGFPFLSMNSSDPRVQRTMQWAQQSGRNTSYARTLYYPYGGDLAKTLVDLTQMWRGRQQLPPATFKIATEDRVPAPAGERCAHITGQVDAQDGKGLKELNSVFCQGPLAAHGSFMNLAYNTAVPVRSAPNERATMAAILASFNVNTAIVEAQAGVVAAPAIAAIHEIGRKAAQQAADAHAANDRYNRGVEQRWDSRDKGNQAFSNYLLDQTEIKDNELNAHGTVWNQTADRLVHDNPQRYEYVDTPNFWKGVDY